MSELKPVRLIHSSKGSGCGCKIPPGKLRSILSGITAGPLDDLLVGNDSGDDACVYRLNSEQALISTVDFFTPLVDDPFLFGKIAAANAVSDVFAMGGKPVLAMSVLGWPLNQIDISIAGDVLRGASSVCAQLGIPLAGGHSIESTDPFFGLSVNGIAHPLHIKTNNTARPGDILFLTKPIGSGVLSAALKKGEDLSLLMDAWMDVVTRVNVQGALFGQLPWIHAVTDITGFGIIGHMAEMCDRWRLTAQIDYQQIKLLPGVQDFVHKKIFTGASGRNWEAFSDKIMGVEPGSDRQILLCDPQTNGGLMVAVDQEYALEFARILEKEGLGEHSAPIGRFLAPSHSSSGIIEVF